ncbi:hypothetical protein PVIIG_06405 [Plasmodium vivax India VII]|uniref:Variable surface protein Vir18 n=1 Tax=Plasmodium vivax India VII TaxID=1077284 RepID=A0A0J9UUS8_PLAVI|nr:hypothetical protein PVIIG_06405 [Plasmodium vivax India VII]
MAKPGGTISITIFDSSNILDPHKCLDKYEEVVEDIEDKIDQFNRQQNNGCEEWVKLIEHINIKKKDLEECYKRQFLTLYLNRSDKIRGFRDKYAKHRECPNNPAYRAEGPDKLQAKTEDSCEAKKNCGEITKPSKQQAEPKAEEGKSQPGLDTKTPERRIAEKQKLLQTGHPPAQKEEPSQEKLIQQVPHDTNPSDDSDETHVKTLKSRGKHPSGIPEELESQAESSSTLEASADQKYTSSKEISFDGDSDPDGSSEAVGLSGRGHQSNSDDGASSDSNLPAQQSYGKYDEEQTHDDKGVTTGTSADAPLSLKTPARDVVTNGENSSHTDAVRESEGDKAPACGTPGGRSADSECTDDKNLDQPGTSYGASYNKAVGHGVGGADKDICSANGDTHVSSAVTTRTAFDGKFSYHIANIGEQSDKSFPPKVASVQTQEGEDTVNGTVHQDAQCQNENLLRQPKACHNPQLVRQEPVYESKKDREKEYCLLKAWHK